MNDLLGVQALLAILMASLSLDQDDPSRSVFLWLGGIGTMGLISHVFYPIVALMGLFLWIGSSLGLFLYHNLHAHGRG